jgi:hypothetical protein
VGLQLQPAWIPLHPDLQQVQHPAELDRNLLEHLSGRSGVTRPGGFAGTVVPAAMQLEVAAGAAFIEGRENNTQGFYFAWSNASETLSWPASGGSQRVDSLILRVADPQYGTISGNSRVYWDAVAGSGGSARPDSDFNSGGSQYVPGAWLRVFDVTVGAGVTQLTQGNVVFKAGYANAMGYVPYNTALAPTGLYPGEDRWNLDRGYRETWDGSLWRVPATRVLKGKQITNSTMTTLTSGVTTRIAINNMTVTTVPLVQDRWYKVWTNGSGALNTVTDAAVVVLKTGVTTTDGVDLASRVIDPIQSVTNAKVSWRLERLFKATSTTNFDFIVIAHRLSATSSGMTIGHSGASDPSHLVVEEYCDNAVITVV